MLLLQKMHLPENWIQKVQELPKAAGSLAAALVLYKVLSQKSNKENGINLF